MADVMNIPENRPLLRQNRDAGASAKFFTVINKSNHKGVKNGRF